jgi:hypothetical protein
LELFNVFERGARRLLKVHPAWRKEQIAFGPAPSLLLVGLGRMGENVLLHAVREWRSQAGDPARRLRVQVIDRNALRKVESLNVRYPRLAAACDLVPLQMEIYSPEFERGSFLFNDQNRLAYDAIYICVDDDTLGLHAGLTLARQLPEAQLPVVIRMTEDTGLAKLLENRRHHHGAFQNLFGYGYLNHTCTPELLDDTPRDRLARAAYEETLTPGPEAEQPGPGPAWQALDADERQACYRRVDGLHQLLERAGYAVTPIADWDEPVAAFSPEEVERMACLEFDQSHMGGMDSWVALPAADQEAERARVRGIPAFLARAGYQAQKS